VEFYSATNKNEILFFAGKWMELENIILSDVSKVQIAKGHMFSLIYKHKKYHENRSHTREGKRRKLRR
jgi:hypothetical protein